MIREFDYERSTSVPTKPLARPVQLREARAGLSGLVVLIGGLLALLLALTYVSYGTEAQAVAWAFFVAGVLAALRKWA
jgi:hypothetical protein